MHYYKRAVALSFSTLLCVSGGVAADELSDLKALVQKLSQRVNELEQRQASAPAAESKAVTSGSEKVKLSISGQVNRGVLYADDGTQGDLHHVDNDASSTRVRFIGEAKPSEKMTVGAAMEVQFESNSTATVSQVGVGGTDNFTQRRLEIYFDHMDYGKLWLGQGWTASEGTSEVDLSGTALAGYSDTDILAGGTLFRSSTGVLSGTSVGSVLTNFDGMGRDDRLRYDTPNFAGFTGSLSIIQDEKSDVALKYSNAFGGTRIAGAIAYANTQGSTFEDQINGSASILLPSGLNFTLAAGSADAIAPGRNDSDFYYGKIGYRTKGISSAGTTAFSIDYHNTDDLAMNGDKADSIGLQAVQNVDDWGTEFYLGLRQYSLDRAGSSFDDVLGVLAGARVKF